MNTREGAFDTKGTSITANPILVQMDPPALLSNYKNLTSMFEFSPPILSLLPCPPSLPCPRILHQVLNGVEWPGAFTAWRSTLIFSSEQMPPPPKSNLSPDSDYEEQWDIYYQHSAARELEQVACVSEY